MKLYKKGESATVEFKENFDRETIDKMRKACLDAGLPEPVFEEVQGFRVTFRKDVFTEDYLRNLGLNERQIKAVMYVNGKGKITNKEYRAMFGITDRTALRDLSAICEKGIFQKAGITGRKTEYTLTRHKPDKLPAVAESGRFALVPKSYGLLQNYPNPFNGGPSSWLRRASRGEKIACAEDENVLS